jgi:acetoin utilization protein AcuA
LELIREPMRQNYSNEMVKATSVGNMRIRFFCTPADPAEFEIMVGFSWTRDLAGARMTAGQYRQMVKSLFKACGFEQYRTHEPNICLEPENLFMCRIGTKVSEVALDRFKWLRFGLAP